MRWRVGPTSFILGRAVIGVDAGLAIYYALLRGRSGSVRALDRYVGLMTAAVGAGLVLSDVLGGAVLAVGGSVREVLWIIAGASLALLAVVWLLVEDVPTRTRVRVDVAGAVLLATGLAALVTGIGHGNGSGWGSSRVIGVLIVAVLLLIAWGAWELHSSRPLIDLRIARRREVWPGYALVAVISTIGIILALAVSEYVQTSSAVGLWIRRLRPHRRTVSSARRTDGRRKWRSRGAGAEPFRAAHHCTGGRARGDGVLPLVPEHHLATVGVHRADGTDGGQLRACLHGGLLCLPAGRAPRRGRDAGWRRSCHEYRNRRDRTRGGRVDPHQFACSAVCRSPNTATIGSCGSSSRAVGRSSVRSPRSYASRALTSGWRTMPRSCDLGREPGRSLAYR